MENSNIGFIGGGNMARSLIGGLISGGCNPTVIKVADPSPEQLAALSGVFPVHVTEHNVDVVDHADVVVLAVKPQAMYDVLASIKSAVQSNHPLIISIAAGISESFIRAQLDADTAIVRCMPNTPALVRSGATALYANPNVSPAQREKAESILRSVGIIQWLDEENLMDAVTAISGSGPAYFFLVMEIIEHA
ncbi:MAG: pyrroline-5-carboxylate reductase, partial [Gammaproteobacteria bacterium]|nr:pyrroline-5-carboxylate reductase [Gammaproteobacteria bacterium]